MGFRFGKSVKLLPGVRLNFSRTGVSTSLGGRGATVNINNKRVRTTLGVPGTGVSYSTTTTVPVKRGSSKSRLIWIIVAVSLVAFLGSHFLTGK